MNNLNIVKNSFTLNIEPWNDIEEKTYAVLKLNRQDCIYLNFTKIFETVVNEMITLDIDINNVENPKIAINLSYLYNIELEYLKNLEELLPLVLPKTKDKRLALKIIKTNIIISTVLRCPDVRILNTIKNIEEKVELWDDIKEKVKFNKGYLVILQKNTIEKLKNLEYVRKKVQKKPTRIKVIKENANVLECLCNTTYSEKIWIRENDASLILNSIKKYKIMNYNPNEKGNPHKIIEALNYLNSTALRINENLLSIILEVLGFSNKEKIVSNKIIDNVYLIGKNDSDSLLIEDINIQKIVNSAASIDLIKKQARRYPYFYLTHVFDSRMRIYVYNWPLNYQLNHLVRNSIEIYEKQNVLKILDRLIKNTYYTAHYKTCNDSLYNKCQDFIDEIKNAIKTYEWVNDPKDVFELKIECFLSHIIKIGNGSTFKEKILSGLTIQEHILKNGYKDYIKNLNLKERKIPSKINILQNLINFSNNKFESCSWADASSNAIQLISLRLGVINKELLMLTNIIENETEYESIYEYVVDKIKEKDHSAFIEKTKNNIKIEEIFEIFSKEESKYLIMPASYGMGKIKNRNKLDESFCSKSINWSNLDKKDKNYICDYIWDSCFDILKEINFDLETYKKKCKEISNNFDAFMWENDIGTKIMPLTYKRSKRDTLLKKLNTLNLRIKECNNLELLKIFKEKTLELKEELKKEDKQYWKRSLVKVKDFEIYTRIFHNYEEEIDVKETKQALIPNTIHAYDASVLNLVCEICDDIGLKIMVIHDSIGCQSLYLSLIKKIFKIANIEIIERNIKKAPFPLAKFAISEDEYKELKIKILESTNFFR